MAVNGIEITIGQRWKTRGGQEVEVIDNDGDKIYPWDLSNGASVTNNGQVWDHQEDEDDDDLITLIQDEHGFIPWNGGECPVGDFTPVEYKMRGYDDTDIDSACSLDWEHGNNSTDIIAYRVVKQEEQVKEIVTETKTEAKEEPKYTVEQVFFAINEATADSVAYTNTNKVKSYLAKTQDPDYNLYLKLKAKFE